MKHAQLEALIANYLNLMTIHTTQGQTDKLAQHLELVLEANQRVNLTRVTDPKAAALLHTADSLSVLEDVQGSAEGAVLDLGSGAGFPGIPLAICSDRSFTLLDSVAKKVRELDMMVVALGLQGRVRTMAGRAEALARVRPSCFTVVVARAVSEVSALLELSSPLLEPEGRLICMKGSPSLEETRRSEAVEGLVGMRLDYQRKFELPEEAGHRTVLCFRKVSTPRVKLPRREGMAQHTPLG